MSGKTVKLQEDTYKKVLKLKTKLETKEEILISMDRAIMVAVNYMNKNFKEINQSDQLSLELKK